MSELILSANSKNCPSCGENFKGNYCCKCGEKVFHPKDLSLKNFFTNAVYTFSHVDTKFFLSLKFLLLKPGLLTKSYISGARVKFGKPMQIFLLSNLFFYFVTHTIGSRDYTPFYGDHHFFFLSDYKILSWLQPIDQTIVNAIDSLDKWKQSRLDLSEKELIQLFSEHSWVYSKILVILLIPLYSIVFWVFFKRKLEYFGAAVIMATHFVSLQLILYSLYAFFVHYLHIPYNKLLEYIFFESPIRFLGNFLFNNPFELSQLFMWVPFLFFTIKNIFKGNVWVQFVLAFIICKILFFITFGIYKKVLIVITLWLM
ncbi:MAG TPA: DUF3667 domain-containing protein [Cytophagales bacterium]|nr:DUF3667 domain-containing protein [Cytophagales bacterium]